MGVSPTQDMPADVSRCPQHQQHGQLKTRPERQRGEQTRTQCVQRPLPAQRPAQKEGIEGPPVNRAEVSVGQRLGQMIGGEGKDETGQERSGAVVGQIVH